VELEKKHQKLANIPVGELVNAINELSALLLSRSSLLLSKYPGRGIPFLGHWCRKDNIIQLIENSLGSLGCLDNYVESQGYYKRAFSKGIVTHWIAGNVPTLGLLSLMSGILTKNANLIRVPSSSDNLLIDIMEQFARLGEIPKAIADSIKIIRYDYKDLRVAEAVSMISDVRVIWGSDDSSIAIKALPSKLICSDIVFPDRTSLIIVGNAFLNGGKTDRITRLIAHDASVFEQKACASPHTVFLDTDDDGVIREFCHSLSIAMEECLKKIPKRVPSQKEVSAILNIRTQYDMFHEAWYSEGTEFTILSDDEVKLGPPIGNRTIYVRKMPELGKLSAIIPDNIQTIGLASEGVEYEHITNKLGGAGVHRFTPIGAMTNFGIPWDGIDLPQQMVRWTTRRA